MDKEESAGKVKLFYHNKLPIDERKFQDVLNELPSYMAPAYDAICIENGEIREIIYLTDTLAALAVTGHLKSRQRGGLSLAESQEQALLEVYLKLVRIQWQEHAGVEAAGGWHDSETFLSKQLDERLGIMFGAGAAEEQAAQHAQRYTPQPAYQHAPLRSFGESISALLG